MGIGRNGCRHRLDGHGDDGMRVLRRADGDALQNLVVHLRNRQAHRDREIADDAKHSGGRRNLSRIHPRRRDAGKHFARGAGIVAGIKTRPDENL